MERKLTELNDRVSTLNIELLEHLTQGVQWLVNYSANQKLSLPNLEALGHLLIRSQAIIREIAEEKYTPLAKNPVISSTLDDKRPPDKLPVYSTGGWIHPLRGGAKRCQTRVTLASFYASIP